MAREDASPDLVLAQEAIEPDHLSGHGALIGPAGSSYGWETWVAALDESVDVGPGILSDLMPVFEGPLYIVLGGDPNVTNQPMEGDPGGWWHAQHEVLFDRLDELGMVSVTDLHVFDRGEGTPGCTCGQDAGCRHVRTIRHGNREDSTPYPDDWLFVSKTLEHQVRGGRVVHEESAWQRSDHFPFVLDLDLRGTRPSRRGLCHDDRSIDTGLGGPVVDSRLRGLSG